MANYVYRCEDKECAHLTGASRTIANRGDCPVCNACSGKTRKIITPISFSFNEGDRPESSKNDSYWTNAQSEKEKHLRKSQDEVVEKAFYNDPLCPEKYKGAKEHLKKNGKIAYEVS